MDFPEWLQALLSERGIGVRELSRMSGLSPAAISNVLNRNRGVGAEFCQAIARALKLPEDEPLFVSTRTGDAVDRQALRRLLVHIGERAGVSGVHPHKFRHTFAINYLRNGGDIFTLQRMMGHTSLEMVKRYLAVASTDVKSAHRRASPVANWKL